MQLTPEAQAFEQAKAERNLQLERKYSYIVIGRDPNGQYRKVRNARGVSEWDAIKYAQSEGLDGYYRYRVIELDGGYVYDVRIDRRRPNGSA